MLFDLILVGYGNVAQRFVGLLEEQRATVVRDRGVSVRIVGVATRRHGQCYAARGLESIDLLRISSAVNRPAKTADTLRFLRDALHNSRAAAKRRRLVVVETTTLEIRKGEPAASYIRAA